MRVVEIKHTIIVDRKFDFLYRLFLFFKLFLLLKLKNKIRIKIKILEKNFFFGCQECVVNRFEII